MGQVDAKRATARGKAAGSVVAGRRMGTRTFALLSIMASTSTSSCQDVAPSDDFGTPDAGTCNTPLPPTDAEGQAWPSYSAALDQLRSECDAPGRTYLLYAPAGHCTDGKTFIARSGGFTGDMRYFEGETLVGAVYWGDVITPECVPGSSLGDIVCEQVDEVVLCRGYGDDAGTLP